jgi:hypothetical protein
MDYFEKGSPVRQHVTQEVHNDVSFLRKVQAQSLSVDDIQISKTVQTSRTLDVFALFEAVLEDPFNVESWKASFTISEVDGSVLNGVYETSGDFSTETSYANLVGVTPSDDGTYKQTIYSAAYFTPNSSEGVLGALWDTSNVKSGGAFNAEWTYSYEEDASATGSDPKYLHDFRLIIDSLQILGYVVINADDSESHNFIIDSAA